MSRPPGDPGPDAFAVDPGRYRLRSGVVVVVFPGGAVEIQSVGVVALEDEAVSLGCWGKRFPVRRRGLHHTIALDDAGARMALGRIEAQAAPREPGEPETPPDSMTHDEWDRELQRRRKRELYESRRK